METSKTVVTFVFCKIFGFDGHGTSVQRHDQLIPEGPSDDMRGISMVLGKGSDYAPTLLFRAMNEPGCLGLSAAFSSTSTINAIVAPCRQPPEAKRS